MGRTDLRLVDGARLEMDAPSAPALRVSSQAMFMLPEGRLQAIRSQPAGFSYQLDEWYGRGDFAERDYSVHARRERPLAGGVLRLAQVSHATSLNVRRRLGLAFWEHRHGCIVLSRTGLRIDAMERLFEALPLRADTRGVSVQLPVNADARPPAALTFIAGLGQLIIHPLTALVLRELPAGRGRRVAHGELFRVSDTSGTVLFVGNTSRVTITPEHGAVDLARAEQLAVEWVKSA